MALDGSLFFPSLLIECFDGAIRHPSVSRPASLSTAGLAAFLRVCWPLSHGPRISLCLSGRKGGR